MINRGTLSIWKDDLTLKDRYEDGKSQTPIRGGNHTRIKKKPTDLKKENKNKASLEPLDLDKTKEK